MYKKRAEEGAQRQAEWNQLLERYKVASTSDLYAEFKRRCIEEVFFPKTGPRFFPGLLQKISPLPLASCLRPFFRPLANKIPELIGGSADLTGSNLTRWKGAEDFQPPESGLGSYNGRYLRYGVREHGMAAISNGIACYGGNIPFASTFLNFISYAAGASRLSALSELRVLYIMTHDSIGLGEDGPTHQPIETLAMLRATPNFLTFRPADGNETAGAYYAALRQTTRPAVFSLTRQNLPQLKGTSIENVLKGGYILQDTEPSSAAQITLIGTGSETSICVDAAKELKEKYNIQARIVSMPCTELFDEQPDDYRRKVLGEGIPSISVEALSTFGWHKYAHHPIGIDTFGASGPYLQLYKKFGLTPEDIAAKAATVVKHYQTTPVPSLYQKLF